MPENLNQQLENQCRQLIKGVVDIDILKLSAEGQLETLEDDRLSERHSLKPNLRHRMFVCRRPQTDQFYYYVKTQDDSVLTVELAATAGQVFTTPQPTAEEQHLRSHLTATIIVLYYQEMIRIYQEQVAHLNLKDLYNRDSTSSMQAIETLMKDLTLFFVKLYYRYPMYEQSSSAAYLEYLMVTYHIDEQIGELSRVLNLIREIGLHQLERKEDMWRERWNVVFAVLGCIIAGLEIFIALFK